MNKLLIFKSKFSSFFLSLLLFLSFSLLLFSSFFFYVSYFSFFYSLILFFLYVFSDSHFFLISSNYSLLNKIIRCRNFFFLVKWFRNIDVFLSNGFFFCISFLRCFLCTAIVSIILGSVRNSLINSQSIS